MEVPPSPKFQLHVGEPVHDVATGFAEKVMVAGGATMDAEADGVQVKAQAGAARQDAASAPPRMSARV